MKRRSPASGALPKAARDRIARYLKSSGKLQRDLAADLGIPESHLSRMLGRSPASITLATAERLAQAIGMSLAEFFADPDQPALQPISNLRELRNRWLDLLRQTEQLISEAQSMSAPDADALRRYVLDHSDGLDAETAAELIAALQERLPAAMSDVRDVRA